MATSPRTGISLRDFSVRASEPDQFDGDMATTEGLKLEAFENGYKSGWDDARNALEADKLSFCSTVQDAIEASKATYEAACQDIVQDLEPLLCGLARKTLPRVAQTHFAEIVLDLIRDSLANSGDAQLEIQANASTRTEVAALLPPEMAEAVQISTDGDLTDGQVITSLNGATRLTDVSRMLGEIETHIESFFASHRKE
ncbi:hypothetical protein AB0T83_03900 [Fluviibacterium sp. DFM31]|uniref:Flagellar assembly protein FliH/Type III secretion system HrpE domain-containing protein n=1 Tax=Meridianimarinicoccus marinus TaxID=3231483 RepID=A0ABV3L2Y1_9RHOB